MMKISKISLMAIVLIASVFVSGCVSAGGKTSLSSLRGVATSVGQPTYSVVSFQTNVASNPFDKTQLTTECWNAKEKELTNTEAIQFCWADEIELRGTSSVTGFSTWLICKCAY